VGTQGSRQSRTTGRRWATRVVAVAAVATAGLGAAPGLASAAPVAPSDAQLGQAQQEQQAAAAQVGQINAALAEAQSAAAAASAASNIALQDYEEKQAASDEARIAAEAAAAAAAQAEAELTVGRDEVARFARDSYMQGSTNAGAMALITSGSPAEMIERAALLDAAGEHRVDVLAELTVLEEQATDAEEAAERTVVAADALKAEAATLLATAQEQEIGARAQAAALVEQQEQYEVQLAQAQQTLSGLEGQRDAAQAYAAEQQASAQQAATVPAPSSSSGPPASSGSSSGSSGPAPVVNVPVPAPAPVVSAPVEDTTASAPSGSAVQTAIAAAKRQMGLPYSWGGGNAGGPTYGIPPDTRIYGFDCSGLTEYAYAQAGIRIGGTSREQYNRYRNQTVARGDLQPGDLVFWGSGSSYTSIYHVALYIGGGQVVQAPQSGDVVKISTMWFGSDYYGAVRPTG
jgi:peptidoglycan DL-endopeptidase RipA